ncbi:MAG: carboxymuconolactone decarboxylase family protein [Candidatus Binatia bacterium]
MLTMAHKPGILGTFGLLTGAVLHKLDAPLSLSRLRMMIATLRAARRRDPRNEIDAGLQQLIAHACSLSAGCRYCQAHTALSSSKLQVDPAKLDDILHFETSPLFSAAEKAAIAVAFAAGSVPNAATQEHFEELRRHYNDPQIVEIVAVISLFGFLNRWNDTMATALESPARNFAQEHLVAAGWSIGRHGE